MSIRMVSSSQNPAEPVQVFHFIIGFPCGSVFQFFKCLPCLWFQHNLCKASFITYLMWCFLTPFIKKILIPDVTVKRLLPWSQQKFQLFQFFLLFLQCVSWFFLRRSLYFLHQHCDPSKLLCSSCVNPGELRILTPVWICEIQCFVSPDLRSAYPLTFGVPFNVNTVFLLNLFKLFSLFLNKFL